MANSKSFKKCVIIVLAVLMTVGSTRVAEAAKRRGGSALQILPAETLFCVKVNNLDGTLTAVNAYLEGVTPDSFNTKDKVLSKLTKMLGSKKPRGLNVKGTFAIFGVDLPSKEPEVNPFANLFIGALVQVRNYGNFVSRSPNVGEADDDGISRITVDGKEEAIVTGKGRFAVMCPPESRDKLIRFKKMRLGGKGRLSAVLDESEKELFRASPVYLYGNVQRVSKLFAPLVFAQLEAMKMILKKAQKEGKVAMGDPAAIMAFYSEIFEILLKGTDRVAIGIAPTAEKCTFTLQYKAVDGTLIAQLLAAPEGGSLVELLGYLENGSFANVVGKINRKGMNLGYMKMIDLLAEISPDAVGKAETEKFRKLTTKFVDSIGDCVAISMKSDSGKSGPLSFKYVIKVKDEQAFKEVIEEEFRMIEEGMFDKIYKGFGIDINLEIETETARYRDVEICSAKLLFEMPDKDSPQAEMAEKIWGKGGLQYRLALLDGYCAYVFGGDCDKAIRNLVDRIKAGGPGGLASEIETAIDVFGDDDDQEDEEYDFGGTVNFVRILNMMSGFIAASGGPQIKPLDMPTESNIVFAGRAVEGKLLVRSVLPKKHLLEIKAAGKKFGKEMEKGVKEMQKKKAKKKKT